MKTASVTPEAPVAFNIKGLVQYTTLSRATIYRLIREGKLPPPRKPSSRRSIWIKTEIDERLLNAPVK